MPCRRALWFISARWAISSIATLIGEHIAPGIEQLDAADRQRRLGSTKLKAAAGRLDHGMLNDHAGLELPSLEHLCRWFADQLKLEWPGDADGCREVSKVCGRVPWALLSAGVAHEEFVNRVLTAMDAGELMPLTVMAFEVRV